MITTISRKFRFFAAHQMHGHESKCSRIHSHNYRGHVTIKGKIKPDGYVFDISVLKVIMKEVENTFDHTILNDLKELENTNPSVENLSSIIYHMVSAKVLEEVQITLYETEKNFATSGDF